MGIIPHLPGNRSQFNPEMERPFSLDQAADRANRSLDAARIKPQDFAGLYDPDLIQNHLRYVQELNSAFKTEDSPEQREALKLATILEAIVYEQINSNQWLGPNAKSIKSSEYDDLKYGIDCIVRFRSAEQGNNYLALGLDITYKHDVGRKFDRIKSEIDSGKLARIQYLSLPNNEFRGERNLVPRTIVLAEKETAQTLSRLWFSGNNDALKRSPFQNSMISEIRQQLTTFEQYARRHNKVEVADSFLSSLRALDRAVTETRLPQSKYEDPAMKVLSEQLAKFST